MNMQQVVQSRSSANVFGSRKVEREMGTRLESKLLSANATSSQFTGKADEISSHDRLVYLSTYLVGHQVEVHVLDGSVFSGIFHATNAEEEFGIILKMAHLIKDGSQWKKNTSQSLNKLLSKTLIIPGKELVQVLAKGVPSDLDGFETEFLPEKQQELLTDSCISQSRQVEVERQLERWVPDDDAPECPELDNIFDGHWNRGWDQFEANEALFGVKSTFTEDLYTTKLHKGPQMWDLEKEALRIAREIEGEGTCDLHLAEERGIQLHGNLEVDEETRFSAVIRRVDDSGYDDCEDILFDSHNDETFQDISCAAMEKSSTDMSSGKINDGGQASLRSSSMDEMQYSQLSTCRDVYLSSYNDHARQSSAEHVPKHASVMDKRRGHKIMFAEHAGADCNTEDIRKQTISEEAQMSISEDHKSSVRLKKGTFDKGGSSIVVPASGVPLVGQDKTRDSSCEKLEDLVSSKNSGLAQSANSHVRPSSSALSTRSSSVSSFASEKSTLNPHAKEFKLNPSAKSFIPTQTTLRPASPVSDSSFYYPAGVSAAQHMHGMPVGVGIGPSFSAHQPVMFNPQASPAPQPYFHPNGHQYGQQMMIGHPQQVVYMPTYPQGIAL